MEPIIITSKDELAFKRLAGQGPLGKRALYIFQYLFIRADFRKLVKDLREEFGIPPDGFDVSDDEQRKIVDDKYTDISELSAELLFTTRFRLDPKMTYKIDNFVEQCGVVQYSPNMDLAEGFISAIVKEYMLINDFIGLYKNRFGLITVEQYDFSASQDGQEECVELRISIPISVKKDELRDYIDSTWNEIDQSRKDILKHRDQVRFRPRNNFIRDVLILNKYLELENLPKSQREKRNAQYLEIATKRELELDGHKNIPDEGTIRSIVSRLKNEIKEKSAYWEEYEPEPEPDPNYKHSENDDF